MNILMTAAFLLLLASCGASPNNLVPLPAVTPLAKVTQTPWGPVSVGTVKVLPTTYLEANTIGIPFMGTSYTAYPSKVDAWPGSKFVIVAFEQPPAMKNPSIAKPILVVIGAANATQTRWYCANYIAQDGKKFDDQRAFRALPDSEKTMILRGSNMPLFPFAFAFQVPENSTGGTLALDKAFYSIQW
jgi:hypothetical protein